jgi:LDH2 family malate/lactate/ureidoglycolate dehydrogenase
MIATVFQDILLVLGLIRHAAASNAAILATANATSARAFCVLRLEVPQRPLRRGALAADEEKRSTQEPDEDASHH